MTTQDKLLALRARWLDDHARRFDHRVADWVESPIEGLFLAALMVDGWEWPSFKLWNDCYSRVASVCMDPGGAFLVQADEFMAFAAFQPTVVVEGRAYRLDVAFFAGRDRFAIEIDGHDFHEKTREQASRDKRRERDITLAGWRVLRFTGSDIYRDPRACVQQVIDACLEADGLLEDALKAEGRRRGEPTR